MVFKQKMRMQRLSFADRATAIPEDEDLDGSESDRATAISEDENLDGSESNASDRGCENDSESLADDGECDSDQMVGPSPHLV